MPPTKTSTSNGHKRVIDFNKVMAAAAEVDGEPVAIKIGRETVDLPSTLPARVSLLAGEGRVLEAVSELLGEQHAELFWAQKPTVPQVNAFWDQVAEIYGMEDEGE